MRTHRPGETSLCSPSTARRLLLGLTCCLLTTLGAAQDPDAASPPPQDPTALQEPAITESDIRARIATVEADSSLEESVRSAALTELRRTLDALSTTDELISNTVRYQQEAAAAPGLITDLQAELSRAPEPTEPTVDSRWTLQDVERGRDKAAAETADAELELQRLEDLTQRRAERMRDFDAESATARAKLSQLRTDLQSTESPDHPLVAEAQRLRLRAEATAAERAIERLNAADHRNTAEEPLLQLRLDLARRQIEDRRLRLTTWETLLSSRRSEEARQTAEQAATAQHDVASRHANLAEAVENIEQLGRQLTGEDGVVAERAAVGERQSAIDAKLQQLGSGYANALARLEISEASAALGLFLRAEYDKLPSQRKLRAQVRQNQRQLEAAMLQVLLLTERRDRLGDVGTRVRDFLATVDVADAERRSQLEAAATELFSAERDLVDRLRRDYEAYVKQLFQLDESGHKLLALSAEYADFIGSRILWVQSVDRPFELRADETVGGLLWLLRGDPTRDELATLGRRLAGRWYLPSLLALLLTGSLLLRRRARRATREAAPLVQRYRSDNLWLTGRAVGWTLLAALPLPLLLLGSAWILREVAEGSLWQLSWSASLLSGAWFFLALTYLLEALRADGLAPAHFRWPKDGCQALHRALSRYLVPVLWIGAMGMTLRAGAEPAMRDTAGRLLVVAANALLAALAWRCLKPTGPVLATYYARHPNSLLTRAKTILLVIGVGLPVLLCVATVLGYLFTALVYGACTLYTVLLVLELSLLDGLAERWLFFHRRQMAFRQFEVERAQRELTPPASTETETELEDKVDIPALDSDTRALFRSATTLIAIFALLSIWSVALPALQLFERIQVWPRLEWTQQVEQPKILGLEIQSDGPAAQPEQVAETAPEAATETETEAASETSIKLPGMSPPKVENPKASAATPYRLTLANLLLALVFGAVTSVITRYIPSLLEIALRSRTSLDAGARYAVATILRYLLVFIGVSMVFGALGIGWSSVQWLAAALTFGLAFGLQEIFANFISGLILLVERPIRVGDMVTVGTLTGRVARIRTRATTILDFDNKELLVPNKTLITGEVTNWTLSDSITRLNIPVGVAYSSDTRKVCETLMRAGQDCPFALDEPAPTVLFSGFGDSSLDFVLRIYIANRDAYIDAINDARTRIVELFRDQGIEIPFPQRDLHLRSAEAPLRIDDKK